MIEDERFTPALAPIGNLFLLVTLPELRRQRLTYLQFYALQRAVGENARQRSYSEQWLLSETGLRDYETSRAVSALMKRGLVSVSAPKTDGRQRIIVPTVPGRRIVKSILSAASFRFWRGIPFDDERQVAPAKAALEQANRVLFGDLLLGFPVVGRSRTKPAGRKWRRAPERTASGW